MAADSQRIARNFETIRQKTARASERAGRSLADITIVAVTKTVSTDDMRLACENGLRHFGENRVQEAESKRPLLSSPPCDGITWHLIGHLQSNKAKKAVELFDRIQSLDSLPLAERLNREAASRDRTVPCLVEIKVSDEPTKFGLPPDELDAFLDGAAALEHLRLEGLMTIAPYFDDAAEARPYFRRARELFDKNLKRFAGPRPVLSMGMSADFEIAVEEGSNMIRIGTALFGSRPK